MGKFPLLVMLFIVVALAHDLIPSALEIPTCIGQGTTGAWQKQRRRDARQNSAGVAAPADK